MTKAVYFGGVMANRQARAEFSLDFACLLQPACYKLS